MQLKKIYFDAYKSLLNTELEITDSCIGLVGSNESGKTNILSAIEVLSLEKSLTISDTPRMDREKNPALRFEFQPSKGERKAVESNIAQCLGHDKVPSGMLPENYAITYNISFDRDELTETRHFTIDGVSLPDKSFVLKTDALTEQYKFLKGDSFVPLENALLIHEAELQKNIDLVEKASSLDELNMQIEVIKLEIKEIKVKLAETQKSQEVQSNDTEATEESKGTETSAESDGADSDSNASEITSLPAVDTAINSILTSDTSLQLHTLESKLTTLNEQKTLLIEEIGEFNAEDKFLAAEEELEHLTDSVKTIELDIRTTKSTIDQFTKLEALDEVQKKELTANRRKLTQHNSRLRSSQETIVNLKKAVESLNQPLIEKYSNDPNELSRRLQEFIRAEVETHLPKVILWKHKPNYILEGSTEFNVILDAKKLNDISRPLVNLFRIGLEIDTMEDLKKKITEIQTVPSERRRHEDSLNENINTYIKSVWHDYDQKIRISLEQEQILVQFYDPDYKYRSYYEMNERSQGCKTFISFLLTIGAEAKQGVIKNTVLLLDEPETHLHPSGVRFMLKELIKAARNDNKVVFATHSIFMIDRDRYNRHVIIKKDKERTSIKPSSRNRIGYFMQEEVLYRTLDIDLNKDFNSTNNYNFVFEGDGDARLFKHFYSLLSTGGHPFDLKKTSFYHGGKCSDIKKYLKDRPIQLGSTWVFILDRDKPANDLKAFLESRYASFLDKYIFIYQYERNDWIDENIEVEMEDLLPKSIIEKAITDAASTFLEDEEKVKEISARVDVNKPFSAYFKEICLGVPDDNFKGDVKSALNSRIAEQIEQTKTKAEFNKLFKDYSSWTQNVIDNINGLCKSKAKQVKTPEPGNTKKTENTGKFRIEVAPDTTEQTTPQPKTS